MAAFKVGDYVFLPNGGPRSRIEKVVSDNSDESLVVYFIVEYQRGACGCIAGAGLKRDQSGLPSDSVANEKTKDLQRQVEALVKGLPNAPTTALADKIVLKKTEIEGRIREIEALWRPRYYSHNLQPFNNLMPVLPLAYTRTVLRRKTTNYYYTETNGAQRVVNSKQEGMEFVIMFHEPQIVLVGTVGHSPMALGRQTVFAGHVMFDSSGKLLEWNNNTGHYKTVAQYAPQAADVKDEYGQSILPLSKYRNLM